jgi:histone acetyltransferase (RNA polymerase elongator complex component)
MLNTFNLNLDKELYNFNYKENQYTIPVFIPHLGCKNECVFCNQRKISGIIKEPTRTEIINTIESYLNSFKIDKKVQIAFFGGSFTGLDFNKQIEYLEIANEYIKTGKVDSIRISTRPDYIDVYILKMLKKYNVKTIEFGVQSMDNYVLKSSKRGHDDLSVIRACRLVKLFNFQLGIQIMIGLPESTLEKEIYTLNKIISLKPEQIRIYPVYVIEDSELYEMYNNSKYKELSFEDAIYRCIKLIEILKDTEIKIIKLGLQSSDYITQNNKKIIGPVSDNFAEYVLAKIALIKIEEYIKDNYVENVDKELNILVNSKYLSITIGPKKINKEYIEKKYNILMKVKGV